MRDTENKQAICQYLLWALQKTRNLGGLRDLIYDERKEVVTAIIETEAGIYRAQKINVEADSGIAMMKDIIRALE